MSIINPAGPAARLAYVCDVYLPHPTSPYYLTEPAARLAYVCGVYLLRVISRVITLSYHAIIARYHHHIIVYTLMHEIPPARTRIIYIWIFFKNKYRQKLWRESNPRPLYFIGACVHQLIICTNS